MLRGISLPAETEDPKEKPFSKLSSHSRLSFLMGILLLQMFLDTDISKKTNLEYNKVQFYNSAIRMCWLGVKFRFCVRQGLHCAYSSVLTRQAHELPVGFPRASGTGGANMPSLAGRFENLDIEYCIHCLLSHKT